MTGASLYPVGAASRDRWILERRGSKTPLDPWRAYERLWEEETGSDGSRIPTATVFLTNRECPYRCLMCDLWRNTLDERVPAGAIPAQIAAALSELPPARQVKLYNAGSFFDPAAIPPEDYPAIASLLGNYERVIVECHPKLIGDRCLRFRDLITGKLEVAIGLETAHGPTLALLNKRLDLDDFRRAARLLAKNDIALRVFLLVRPPFMSENEGLEWAKRSLQVAYDAGADVCSLISTRGGNGAMETLSGAGDFAPPNLRSMETAQEYGLSLVRGRVFSDLWDIERFATCICAPRRVARLKEMNVTQRAPDRILCDVCLLDLECGA